MKDSKFYRQRKKKLQAAQQFKTQATEKIIALESKINLLLKILNPQT